SLKHEIETAAGLGAPMVISHQGVAAWRPAGLRIAGAPGTEEHQASFLRNFVEAFDSDASVSGWMLGTLCDHRDPGCFYSTPPFIRRRGLLNKGREPKLAYKVLSDFIAKGQLESIPKKKVRIPITSFSKILALGWLIAAVVLFINTPRTAALLAFDPAGFSKSCSDPWKLFLFVSVFSALNLAILTNRLFQTAPRRLIGSIDMPFFRIVSGLIRSEITLFLWSFFSIVWFWVFNTSLLNVILPSATPFQAFALTASLCLPDIVFVFSAFFRVSLPLVFIGYNIWRLYLCYTALGLAGTAVYVILGPSIVAACIIILAERKFHIFKYVRKLM
ncbi:MAG TPA: hypothetical protein PLQ76_00330, partial [bacterium]|nr:hypothetical protein [bacterium]